MLIDFTEFELKQLQMQWKIILIMMMKNLNTELLFGGLSVADRVTSINNKIDSVLYN